MMPDWPPLVSVVVPCFNRARTIVPTLDSIWQQDYPRIECIVVDGGSSDGTLDILKGCGQRITWISEPDRGPADAINKGWKMSRGEILTWLNADDRWAVPNAVRQAVTHLQANPEVDVVYGACGFYDVNGNLIEIIRPREWDLAYAVEYCDHILHQPASFIRRTILEKVGWLDTAYSGKHDHELWYRIGLAGIIRGIPPVLAYAGGSPSYQQRSGDKIAANCVAITRRFFALPGVPQHLASRRRRAISNAYLRGTEWAYYYGRYWRVIWSYAGRAALADPSNALSAVRHLAGFLRVEAVRPMINLLVAAKRRAGGWAERMTSFPDVTKNRKDGR